MALALFLGALTVVLGGLLIHARSRRLPGYPNLRHAARGVVVFLVLLALGVMPVLALAFGGVVVLWYDHAAAVRREGDGG